MLGAAGRLAREVQALCVEEESALAERRGEQEVAARVRLGSSCRISNRVPARWKEERQAHHFFRGSESFPDRAARLGQEIFPS